MKNITSIAAIAALLAAGSAASATSFVNGDFSSNGGVGQIGSYFGNTNTYLTGWNVNGGYDWLFNTAVVSQSPDGYAGVNGDYGNLRLWGSNSPQPTGADLSPTDPIGAPPVGGNWVVALDGDWQTKPFTQSISGLTVGEKYNVTFAYGFGQQYTYNGVTQQNLTVSLGGQSFTTPTVELPSHGFSGWTAVTDSFTATGATETLSFLAYGNLPVPPFTLISGVSVTAVPELSTWAMLLAGFGGLGLIARLRRHRSAVAAA